MGQSGRKALDSPSGPGEQGKAGQTEEEVRRGFRDARGRGWEVFESPIPSSDWTASDEDALRAGYGVGWLRFESGEMRRHLRLYPQLWKKMTDAELDRLCEHAREGAEPPIL